ncbi:pyridoxamine 5'-phosphate oxidase [Labilibacter marinus]|uniref:pyridoxamine 5'-phosphate oxidase n=1 Tax=Labilibacter marinus TaxID=1477105 RepID=UPI00094F4C20|nr:pyridoxamine 5'-phosphate oxidase [Labilibacter marinus]
MNRDLSQIRKDFIKDELHAAELNSSPFLQFKEWLNEAIDKGEHEPTAMTLCTVNTEGIPSARVVLLKKLEEESGFWFFTNYSSKKGLELEENKNAAVNFFWAGMERQVRITGVVEKVSPKESDEYFYSRPEDSQLSAITSPQSQVIESRQQLEDWYEEAKQKEIKRPDNWGGYALIPTEMEFWQGRSGRLHDRIRYRWINSNWQKERLAP